MTEKRTQRRLAAILAADVVGYSRLMEQDEAGTLAALKARQQDVLAPLVARHNGRIVKLMGDGVLVEFGSAVDAVQCAVELQKGYAAANQNVMESSRIILRIGINIGDVIVQGQDIFGDGVNVAARLEGLAEPGGIYISGTVHDHINGKLAQPFTDLGEHSLKNIARRVRVYRARSDDGGEPTARLALAFPDMPSIAVLPFTNMSSDPEQEFFAEGIVEDLITDLSKVAGLLVIARHSSFAYKGKPLDIRQIAGELGVRYIVEGSIRRAAGRVRINAQLIDANANMHLWADRFDRDLTAIFELQDEVVNKIMNALANALPLAQLMASKRATNLEAYDCFVRGRAMVTDTPERNKAARELLDLAIELEPGFADAHAWLAASHLFPWAHWNEPVETNCSLAHEAAARAVTLDPQNAFAHGILGTVLQYERRPTDALAELNEALRINPNHADAWMLMADLQVTEGRPDEGLAYARNAFQLNPHPPAFYYWGLGYAEYAAGKYEEAIKTLCHASIYRLGSKRILAASLAQLGCLKEAQLEVQLFLASNPHFSIAHWAGTQPFRYDRDRQHFIDGYVKAGLPM
jgi:TolB-like protein